jgi:hypothetical protein
MREGKVIADSSLLKDCAIMMEAGKCVTEFLKHRGIMGVASGNITKFKEGAQSFHNFWWKMALNRREVNLSKAINTFRTRSNVGIPS